MATSVVSAVDWWAKTKGDEVALVFADDTVTYRSLRDWSSRLAQHLVAEGLQPGDRVAVLGGNTPEWAAAAFAVLRAGAVLLPLNPRLVAAELHKLVRDAGARTVISEAAYEVRLKEVEALGASIAVLPMAKVCELRDGGAESFTVDVDPEAPAALLFTSGSTGVSKGVICTNRTLLDIVFEACLREEGFRPGTRSILVLPFALTPGLVWGLIMTTVLGGRLVVEAEFQPSRAVRLIEEHRVQVVFGVPLIFEAMAKAPEFPGADLSSVVGASVGGAAVSVPLLQTWGAKGVKLRQIYGMTEAGGIATATLLDEAEEHAASCGSGSVFTDIRVVRPDGQECSPGEPGEVLLRGPGVTPGYWNDPETTAVAIRDGWLHSGDLGARDEEGRLTFLDRMKDLIISGGMNISPVEIEAVIAQIPGVEEVAVIAAPDERFGETPAAIVTVSRDVDESEIVAVCNQQMADYKVPRYVVVRRDPLPRLPSGKLSKREIRDEYADVSTRFSKVR